MPMIYEMKKMTSEKVKSDLLPSYAFSYHSINSMFLVNSNYFPLDLKPKENKFLYNFSDETY